MFCAGCQYGGRILPEAVAAAGAAKRHKNFRRKACGGKIETIVFLDGNYTTPCAIMASATFSKPAMFAPAT